MRKTSVSSFSSQTRSKGPRSFAGCSGASGFTSARDLRSRPMTFVPEERQRSQTPQTPQVSSRLPPGVSPRHGVSDLQWHFRPPPTEPSPRIEGPRPKLSAVPVNEGRPWPLEFHAVPGESF